MARMAQRLTNEGNVFLGEKIIEVRRVGPPQEVWYKLGESYNVCELVQLTDGVFIRTVVYVTMLCVYVLHESKPLALIAITG